MLCPKQTVGKLQGMVAAVVNRVSRIVDEQTVDKGRGGSNVVVPVVNSAAITPR